jgi:hypothetical protein
MKNRYDEFKSLIPEYFPESLKGDFASELQWNSWQAHLMELQEIVCQSCLYDIESCQCSDIY